MKCLVSGATGFIGRQLCEELERRGNAVIALSRSGAPLPGGAPTHALDLTVSDPEESLLRGVDVFIHLAGVAHQHAVDSAYEELNHRATVRLARLASSAGIKCFIFVSSVKAMGPSSSPCVRSECDSVLPVEAYGLSKWRAERVLKEAFADDRMSVVIVRPALVYGARVKGNLQQLAKAVRCGLPRPPAIGSRSMIALGDLVGLLCVIAQRPPLGVHTWIACGRDSYSTQRIYDLLRKASGKGRGVGWLPRWAWRLAAQVLDIVSGRRNEPTYDKLFGTELYSNAAVLAGTQWRPRVRLEDEIEEIAVAARAGS